MKRVLAAALILWAGAASAQVYNPPTLGSLVPGGAITNAMLAGSITASKLVGSDITTVGALTSGSIASGFGTIATANAISTTSTLAVGVASPLASAVGDFKATTDQHIVLRGKSALASGASLGSKTDANADAVLEIMSSAWNFTSSGVGVLDYGTTTGATITSSVATTFSHATIKMTGITTGTNADTVCLKADGTLLIQAAACTISSMRFKNLIGGYGGPLDAMNNALDTITKLEPIVFTMKPGEKPNPDPNYERPQIGLSAENVAAIEARCAIYEDDGVTPKSYRQECLIAVLVAGMQAQQREIERLKAR